jgi:Zn finger protein HypA/HybF involved in hydrogenase expression
MSTENKPHIDASWTVELNCDCPHCKESVDPLTAPDFWDGTEIELAEHNTERSRNLDVYCPECGKEFTVNCTY